MLFDKHSYVSTTIIKIQNISITSKNCLVHFPGQLVYYLKTLSRKRWSDFCTYDCASLRMAYGMWHFKFTFLHLVQCLGGFSMLLGRPVGHSFFAAECYVIVCVLYLSVEGYLSCFQSGVIMNNSLWVFVYMFLYRHRYLHKWNENLRRDCWVV